MVSTRVLDLVIEARTTSQPAIATTSASSCLGPAATAKPLETQACLTGSVPKLQALSSKRGGQWAIIPKEKRKFKRTSSGLWQHTCIVPCSPRSRSVNDAWKKVSILCNPSALDCMNLRASDAHMPRSRRGGARLCCATLPALPLAVTSTGTQRQFCYLVLHSSEWRAPADSQTPPARHLAHGNRLLFLSRGSPTGAPRERDFWGKSVARASSMDHPQCREP